MTILASEIDKSYIKIITLAFSALLFSCAPEKSEKLNYLQSVLGKQKLNNKADVNEILISINSMVAKSDYFKELLENIQFMDQDYLLVNPFLEKKTKSNPYTLFPQSNLDSIQFSDSYSTISKNEEIFLNIHYLTFSIENDPVKNINSNFQDSLTYNDQWYQINENNYLREMAFKYKSKQQSQQYIKSEIYKVENTQINTKIINEYQKIHHESLYNLSKVEVFNTIKKYSMYKNLYISNIFLLKEGYSLSEIEPVLNDLKGQSYHLQIIYYSFNLEKIIETFCK